MSDTREDLEQRLLADPFDGDLRSRYGEVLLAAGDAAAALRQFELVCQQNGAHAEAHLGAARALLRLDRQQEAVSRYTRARTLSGFEPDPELDELESRARRTAPQLRVVPGRAGNVTAIQQVPEERVRFSSIVGMEDLKKTIRIKIVEPFTNPGLFQRFRKQAGGGVLLYGPPGCGKTMIARAVANECSAEFLSVGIADVLSMWHGESERNLAAIFEKARSKAPCVLFFDELDALAYARSKASSEHTRTVVNSFLSELDGVGKDNRSVLILAATNMPWDVDPAMKRPGRFSRQIFVPPPDAAARGAMLELKLTGVPCEGLDLAVVARRASGYSGADIDGLIELAKEAALHESIETGGEVSLRARHFEHALETMQPTTEDWLRTVRNLVKYAGSDPAYRDVETFLRRMKLL